jgi:hypothetical protein
MPKRATTSGITKTTSGARQSQKTVAEDEEQRHADEPGRFAQRAADEERAPVLFVEVAGQLEDAGEEEAQEVPEEAAEAVATVRHRGAQVLGQVVLGMVHPQVVGEERLRRFAEEGTEHRGDVVAEEAVRALEEGAVAGVVQHEDVRPDEPEHEPEVQHREPPVEGAGDEQRDARRDHRHRKQGRKLEERQVAAVHDEALRDAFCRARDPGQAVGRVREGDFHAAQGLTTRRHPSMRARRSRRRGARRS